MRGRKPQPTELKIIRGNPGKRPLNNDEPKPKKNIPDPPEHIQGDAKKEWDRITQELYKVGLITDVDCVAMAAYCQCYQRWIQAEEGITKSGLMVKTTNGNIIQSPLVGIANKSMLMMHKFLVEFGMTPSSRTRIGKSGDGQKENSFTKNKAKA